jgi:hypothetical protein
VITDTHHGFVSFDEENEMSVSSQRGGWLTAWQAPPTDAVTRGDASLTDLLPGRSEHEQGAL